MSFITHNIHVYTPDELIALGFHDEFVTTQVALVQDTRIMVHDDALKIMKKLQNLNVLGSPEYKVRAVLFDMRNHNKNKMERIVRRCKGRVTKYPDLFSERYYYHPEQGVLQETPWLLEYMIGDIQVSHTSEQDVKLPCANRYKFIWGALTRESTLQNGKLHSYDDEPARIVYSPTFYPNGAMGTTLATTEYYHEGERHRDMTPAIVCADDSAINQYYKKGVNVTDRVQGAIQDDGTVDGLVWDML